MAPRTLDVAIHRDSSGAPGQRLFALDNPPTICRFTQLSPLSGAPPGSRLTANTTYWVVAGTSSGTCPSCFDSIRMTSCPANSQAGASATVSYPCPDRTPVGSQMPVACRWP